MAAFFGGSASALTTGALADGSQLFAAMGEFVDPVWKRVLNWTIVGTIVALNLVMVHWTLTQ